MASHPLPITSTAPDVASVAPPNPAPIRAALEGLGREQLWWASGYAAGLAESAAVARSPAASAVPGGRMAILYGSQTGNSRRVAEALAEAASAAGYDAVLLRADTIAPRDLLGERLLLVAISTHGDGDPPDDAVALLEALESRRAPRLESLAYAVIALGDSSYPQFCAVGRRLDQRLAALGARRLLPLAEADLDVEAAAAPWRERVLEQARDLLDEAAPRASVTPLRPAGSGLGRRRERPMPAELAVNQRITARASSRDVRHLELLLEPGGLGYQPGDALGVVHRNPPTIVEAVLAAAGLDADAPIRIGEITMPLHEALAAHRELTRLGRAQLEALAAPDADAGLRALQDDPAAAASWLRRHQLADLLARWPAPREPQALVDALSPMAPRLYSIASSRAEVGDEAHLAVAVVQHGESAAARIGAASTHLATLAEGSRVPVWIEPNERFRLPEDGDRDLVMIGAGTGIAPFRAFVQERVAAAARGRHWLLFGARTRTADFLYQSEWLAARRRGTLQRLDPAFSREGSDRGYVQQRVIEHGRELHDWIEGGAHLRVCGGLAMGQAVSEALVRVLADHGGLDDDGARERLTTMRRERRYALDLY